MKTESERGRKRERERRRRRRRRRRERERRTGRADDAEGGSLMSRRVPRTLRTLKLDYREIAALLLFPPASLPSPLCSRLGRRPPLLRPPRSFSSSTTAAATTTTTITTTVAIALFPESFLSFASPASPRRTAKPTYLPGGPSRNCVKFPPPSAFLFFSLPLSAENSILNIAVCFDARALRDASQSIPAHAHGDRDCDHVSQENEDARAKLAPRKPLSRV